MNCNKPLDMKKENPSSLISFLQHSRSEMSFFLLEITLLHSKPYATSPHKFFYFAFNLICLVLFSCQLHFVFFTRLWKLLCLCKITFFEHESFPKYVALFYIELAFISKIRHGGWYPAGAVRVPAEGVASSDRSRVDHAGPGWDARSVAVHISASGRRPEQESGE